MTKMIEKSFQGISKEKMIIIKLKKINVNGNKKVGYWIHRRNG